MKKDILVLICKDIGLGELEEEPQRLFGGLMHKMYRVRTTSGKYVIKLLNPVIMERADVFNNFAIAEELELKLERARVPIVPSLTFSGKKMQCCQNQYYYIFNWINGESLKSEEIKKEHCSAVGEILAQIHNLERRVASHCVEKLHIDWVRYKELASKDCPEIAALLSDSVEILMVSQVEANLAQDKLPNIISICHNDMDSKNILWQNSQAKIIDLECLCFKNPYIELTELLLSWSGFEHGNFQYELLEAFLEAYIANCKDFKIDWSVLHCSNHGRLQWLKYNLKRALRIEYNDFEEQKLGVEQVILTIKQIIYYNKIKDMLIDKLTKKFG